MCSRLSSPARLLIAGPILGLALACNAPSPPSSIPPTAATAATTAGLPTSVPPTITPTSMRVQIFLIALQDNGQSGEKIGCDDSVVPVEIEVPYTEGVLRAALEELLAIRDQYYGQSGLYNALYQSNLQVESVVLEGDLATINLTGTLMLGGVCDNPRVKAQIEKTALQFSTVHQVRVFVNDVPLDNLLSQQG